MLIATVKVADNTNPVEVQTWFDEHSDATILRIFVNINIFYIVYE